MDLTEFRATYPGLYQQAFDAGRAADDERIATLFELAEAAGNMHLARRAIENGHSVADAMPQRRAFASKDDDRAAAFTRKVDALGLAPRATRTETQTEIAGRLISVLRGGQAAGSTDADLVADIVCGTASAEPARRSGARSDTTKSKADVVADIVCGFAAESVRDDAIEAKRADGSTVRLKGDR